VPPLPALSDKTSHPATQRTPATEPHPTEPDPAPRANDLPLQTTKPWRIVFSVTARGSTKCSR
jgi:hypothetical protein